MKEEENILTKERNKKEARIIVKYLPRNAKSILDAPCSYGRISNSLAALGYKVTGIDISNYFINLARKEAEQQGLTVSYVVGNTLDKKIMENLMRY